MLYANGPSSGRIPSDTHAQGMEAPLRLRNVSYFKNYCLFEFSSKIAGKNVGNSHCKEVGKYSLHVQAGSANCSQNKYKVKLFTRVGGKRKFRSSRLSAEHKRGRGERFVVV